MAAGSEEDLKEDKHHLKERQRYLLNDESDSDVKFLLGNGDQVFAHKTLLSDKSPVFAAMFYGPMATKDDQIQLPDCDDKLNFLEFLRYLYCEECEVDWGNFLTILYLAKKYIVLSLEEKCITFALSNLSVNNVLTALHVACRFEEEVMQQKCIDFICPNAEKVLETDTLLELDLETLAILLKEENLRVREIELFKAVDKWCEHQLKLQDSSSSDIDKFEKRKLLGDAVYLIRFPAMNVTDFADNCIDSGCLTPKECCDIFRMLARPKTTTADDNDIGEPPKKEAKVQRFISKKRRGNFSVSTVPRLNNFLRKIIPYSEFDKDKLIKKRSWNYGRGEADGLAFSVDKPIELWGVTLFGSAVGSGAYSNHIKELYIANGSNKEIENPEFMTIEDWDWKERANWKWQEPWKPSDKNPDLDSFKVLFQQPVYIKANMEYSIRVKLGGRTSNSCHYSDEENTICGYSSCKNRISFRSISCSNGTTESKGQFPGFLFICSCQSPYDRTLERFETYSSCYC